MFFHPKTRAPILGLFWSVDGNLELDSLALLLHSPDHLFLPAMALGLELVEDVCTLFDPIGFGTDLLDQVPDGPQNSAF